MNCILLGFAFFNLLEKRCYFSTSSTMPKTVDLVLLFILSGIVWLCLTLTLFFSSPSSFFYWLVRFSKEWLSNSPICRIDLRKFIALLLWMLFSLSY